MAGNFRPGWFYNEAGDQLEVSWEDDAYYGETRNGRYGYNWLCLHLAQGDKRVVGVTVYDSKHVLEREGYMLERVKDDCSTAFG